MKKIIQYTLITILGFFSGSVFAQVQAASSLQTAGVFSKAAEPSEKGSGIIFTDSATSKRYYLIKPMVSKVTPYLGKTVKVKASVKPVPSGKAYNMVWIIDIKA
jgi:hypothetical protein